MLMMLYNKCFYVLENEFEAPACRSLNRKNFVSINDTNFKMLSKNRNVERL